MKVKRTKMVELIGNGNSKNNKLFIIGPGFQCFIETDMGYDEYVSYVNERMENGKSIIFRAVENDKTSSVIFKPSLHTPVSIVVMNEKAFENWKREQMFAAQKQQLSQYGREV